MDKGWVGGGENERDWNPQDVALQLLSIGYKITFRDYWNTMKLSVNRIEN